MAETENMVERVAMAIYRLVPEGYGMTLYEAEQYARAAIEAMREPTEAMRGAGLIADREDGFSFERIWNAMIDSALQGKG